jgi:hypothetical protein
LPISSPAGIKPSSSIRVSCYGHTPEIFHLSFKTINLTTFNPVYYILTEL